MDLRSSPRPRPRPGPAADTGRRPTGSRGGASACDAAVSEVVGYVLMLFLSASVLVMSLQAFSLSRDNTQDVLDASELKLVADRVASEVLQASAVATETSNATYEVRVRLPKLDTRAYFVNLTSDKVYANTTDGVITAEAGAFQVGALSGMTLEGRVFDTQGYVRIRYEKDLATGSRTISIST